MCSTSPEAAAIASGRRITQLQARINALHGELLTEIDVLDRAFGSIPGLLFPDAAREEISVTCRLSEHQARTRLATARALAGRLVGTQDAMAAGRLSLEHATAMQRATEGLTLEQTSQVEIDVLDDPRAVTPGQLGFRARAAAQRLLDTTVERRVAQAPARSLSAYRDPWGQVGFVLTVPEPDAAVIDTYLGATAGRQGPDDLRPVGERRADALLELVRAALDSGTLPSGGDGRRPHVEISTTVEGLGEGAWHAAEIGGRFVLSGQLRELSCDAEVRTTLLDRDRLIVDQGRTTRVVSAGLRGRLELRDRHCRFPGCEVRPPRCRAHHIRHWADGGRSDAGNLLLLCERHHHAVHDGGWQVQLDLDQATWRSPLGRLVETPGDLAPPTDDLFDRDTELIGSWNEWLMIDPETESSTDSSTESGPPPVTPSLDEACPF